MSRFLSVSSGKRGNWQPPASLLRRLLFTLALTGCSWQVKAQDTAAVSLVDIGQGRGLSDAAASLGLGGYELADGTQVRFSDWYHSDFPELHADFLTQITEDFGIIWGVGTGERGQKYSIDPSLRLGFIAQVHPNQNAVLSLTVNTTFGGKLAEETCNADYGEIGGVQEVNCRLAASELPPQETLQYLASTSPSPIRATLNFHANF
jgi:hypothetical protein